MLEAMQVISLDDATIQKLADAIAQRLKALLNLRNDSVYTSYKLPPDVQTRLHYHRIVKLVPGSVKRGSCWIVPVDSWDRYRESKNPVMNSDNSEHIRAMLKDLGLA